MLTAVDRMSSVVGDAVKKSGRQLTELEKKQKAMQKAALMGTAMVGAGREGLGYLKDRIQDAADFETKMADIRKVVNELQNDPKALAAMGKDIQNLSYQTGIATGEIQDMVAAGGRMGIAKKDLIQYAAETAKMAVAFDMAGIDIGESIGKVSKLFDIPINQISRLADTINYLDDKTIAKGPEIIDVMLRTGATAKQIGLADEKLAALASTFLTLGSAPEVAGTAINALMRELAIAPIQAPRFHAGLKAINMSAKDMAKGMAIDPQKTILSVLDKLNKFPKEEQIQVATLLFGKQYGDDIAKLAVGVKEYRTQLNYLGDAKKKGSMAREFGIRNQTGNAQMQQWDNVKAALSVNVGMPMLEALKELGKVLKPLLIALAEFARRHPNIVKMVGIFTALISVGLILVGTFFLIKAAIIGLALVAGTALWPVTLIVLAIAAVAAVVIVYWKPISGFFIRMWQSISGAFTKAWNFIKNMFSAAGTWLKGNWKTLLIGAVMFPFIGLYGLLMLAGTKIPKMIAQGIKSGAVAVWNSIKDMASGIMDFLPQSPAKKGPLTNIRKVHIVEEIAKTLNPKKANAAMSGMVAGFSSGGGGGSSSSGGYGGGGMTIQLTFAPVIHGDGGTTMDMLRKLQPEIVKLVQQGIEKAKRTSF